MATPRNPANPADATDASRIGKTVMDSAQQIWLAGLGAFAKAQEEGGKLFDALVREGTVLDAKTREYTEARVTEARGNLESSFGGMRERGQETWGKLERVFDDRIARALGRLGVPEQDEFRQLSRRVDELAREVRTLADKLSGKPAATKRPAAKPSAK